MEKQKALEMLGGTVAAAASAIGITYQAVADWPDVLSDRIADRVYAAIGRKEMTEKQPPLAPVQVAIQTAAPEQSAFVSAPRRQNGRREKFKV